MCNRILGLHDGGEIALMWGGPSKDTVLAELNAKLDKPPSRPPSPSEKQQRRGGIKNSFSPFSESNSHAQKRMDASFETIGLRISALEDGSELAPEYAVGRSSPPIVALDRRRSSPVSRLCGAETVLPHVATTAATPGGRRNLMVAAALCLLLSAYFLMMRGLQRELSFEAAGGVGGAGRLRGAHARAAALGHEDFT